MRLLTKSEACWELGASLSTLNRRIVTWEVLTQREPHGRFRLLVGSASC